MRLGIPKEVKMGEHRVGLLPNGVAELVSRGHEVFVESQAGVGVNISDEAYAQVGARISDATTVFSESELIVKVKEPTVEECQKLSEHQTVFTFFHFAANLEQATLMQSKGCCAIAYETVTDVRGRFPILAPMSEVAGRLSVQMGARFLEKHQGGRGILLAGVPGVLPGEVLIIGGGVVGTNAARMAIGLGASVTIIDKNRNRLTELSEQFGSILKTQYAGDKAIEDLLPQSDLVIGAVLLPGAKAPKLIKKSHLLMMKPGAVIVDVAIDQGGCCETSHPTTFGEPAFVEDGIVHVCVANMPGAVPLTSTSALNHETLPFILSLADKGVQAALLDDPHLAEGLQIYRGQITYKPVAELTNQPCRSLHELV